MADYDETMLDDMLDDENDPDGVLDEDTELGLDAEDTEGDDELNLDALLGEEEDIDDLLPKKKAAPQKAAPDPIDMKFEETLDKLNQSLNKFTQTPVPQQQQQQAPQPAPAWVDPFERPENKAKLEQLEDEAFVDPAKMKELRAFERKLMKEQSDHELDERMAAVNAQTQATVSAPRAREAAFKAINAATPAVTREAFDAALAEFMEDALDGNEAILGQLLTNPTAKDKTMRLLKNLSVAKAVEQRQQAKTTPKRQTAVQPKRRAAPSVPARTRDDAQNEVMDIKHLEKLAYGSTGRSNTYRNRVLGIGRK